MPGKSKKGGGLEVGSAYKMKGFSGFGNSPIKQDKKKTDWQKEANEYYLKTGKIHGEGDAKADELYKKMVGQHHTTKGKELTSEMRKAKRHIKRTARRIKK